MARVLFLSFPATGHIYPSLGLIEELVRRGDRVIYYATQPFAARVEAMGAQYCPYRNAFLADMRLPDRTHELAWLLTRTTDEILEEHLNDFRSAAPDYVITDPVAPWGQWTAELLGVPAITSVSTFVFNRHVLGYAAARGVRPRSARLLLEKLRFVSKALGLRRNLRRRYQARGPALASMVNGSSELNIIYTSRLFQPCAETFDERFVFIGPSLAGRKEVETFAWDKLRHDHLVYISLGTIFNAESGFYRACFEALRHEDIQVILVTGANVDIPSLGPIPDNFVVSSHVPQLGVLQRASAFVTHGGMNSVSESLHFGVPMVVVPQMGEQAIVGRRVEELGAGIYLDKAEVSPERLRTSVKQVMTEPGFRRQSARVRESFLSAGGVTRAADSIAAFVSMPDR